MEFSFTLGSGQEQEYKPSPFTVVAIGPFGGGEQAKGGDSPVRVTSSDFDDAVKQVVGELLFEVDNHLGTDDQRILVQFNVEGFKDLTPAGLLAKVPVLQKAGTLVAAVADLAAGKIDRDAFSKAADAASDLNAFAGVVRQCMSVDAGEGGGGGDAGAAPAPAGGDGEGGVFDMVDTSDKPKTAAGSAMGGIIGGIGKSAGRKAAPQFAAALTEAQALLGKQLDTIVHHPVMREVERSWRGLRALVGQMDFRANQELSVIDAPRGAFLDRFEQVLFQPVYTGRMETPAMVVAEYGFTTSPTDMELLQALAEKGEAVQMPVLAYAGPGFFPDKTLAEVAALPDPGNVFTGAAFEKWTSIREKECSRWVAMAANRFLLREPFTPENSRGANYAESVNGEEDYLWGNPAWMVAASSARGFVKHGWATDMTGFEKGRIDGLTMKRIDDKADAAQIPCEALLPDEQAGELYKNGLLVLACEPNRDSVFLLKAPSVHTPERTDDDHVNAAHRRMAQLPYQLLCARLGEEVYRHKAKLMGDGETETIQKNCESFLRGMFANTGEGAGYAVNVEPVEDDPDRRMVTLRVRTGKKLLGGVDVVFGMYA